MANKKITELDAVVTPVNADVLPTVQDTAGTPVTKKITWTVIKAFLKTYFDTLYPSGSGTSTGTNTGNETATTLGATIGGAGNATPNDTDFVATSLTAAGILKKITWTNVKAFLKTYFDTLYAPIVVYKIGVTTRDMTAASGAVTIAHGLGVVPKFVKISAVVNVADDFCWSHGSFISGANRSIWSYSETAASHPDSGTDTTNGIHLYQYNGDTQEAVISVDITNITLTWTKTGAPGGTAQILWEAQG